MEDILVSILLVVMMTAGMALFFGGLASTRIGRCVARNHRQISEVTQAPRLTVEQLRDRWRSWLV